MAEAKSKWDKIDTFMKPVGGLLTALAVALVGIYGSHRLTVLQEADSNQRLYAELMGRREEADLSLRKEMFASIMGSFLKSEKTTRVQDLLRLELLAYNFHDSIDLSPLFKQVSRQFDPQAPGDRVYLDRLQRVAREITGRQLSALQEAGVAEEIPVDLEEFMQHPEGRTFFDRDIGFSSQGKQEPRGQDPELQPRHFALAVLQADPKNREITIHLQVSAPGAPDDREPEVDKLLSVGFFDLPMINNTLLSHDQRCAVVLREFDPESEFAEVTVVYFPGDRASLKYHEALHSLRSAQGRLARESK